MQPRRRSPARSRAVAKMPMMKKKETKYEMKKEDKKEVKKKEAKKKK
jgi:hypothetical protein